MALAVAALLGACATAPKFDMTGVNAVTTPSDAARIDSTRGTKVLWGGVIVNSRNLESSTQLEVLAYPLDNRQRPQTDREPLGRFIVEHPAYLETVDYAAGRLITLIGTITGTRQGRIDEAAYTYPAIASEQMHLWSKSGEDSGPRLHFGVGVMFHN
jgi:outer membrane lipoprotein